MGFASTKMCTKCSTEKPLSMFSVEPYRGGTRVRPECKPCRAEYKRQLKSDPTRNEALKSYARAWGAISRSERYILLNEIKSVLACDDCGGFFAPYVIDFDHRDPTTKVSGVGDMVASAISWDRVIAEIAKCDAVCANCHRLRTYKGVKCKQGRRVRYHMGVISQLKELLPCLDCGQFFSAVQMDFDHLQSETEVGNVSQMLRLPSDVIMQEIAKCHLVCANCHRHRSVTGVRPLVSDSRLEPMFLDLTETMAYPTDLRSILPRRKRGPYRASYQRTA